MIDWGELDRLGDEELIDALIGASLPERSSGRDRLMEILRARFDVVPRMAFRQTLRNETLEEEFVEWLWTYERLESTLKAYRRTRTRGRFKGYFLVKAKWLRKDFHRERKRRPRTQAYDVDGLRDQRAHGGDDPRDFRLAWVRRCIEGLGTRYRVPLKLVHIAALELTSEDWDHLLASGRPRDELEAEVQELRRANRQVTLAEVCALMKMKLHTVGAYVARAQNKVKECIRARAVEGFE